MTENTQNTETKMLFKMYEGNKESGVVIGYYDKANNMYIKQNKYNPKASVGGDGTNNIMFFPYNIQTEKRVKAHSVGISLSVIKELRKLNCRRIIIKIFVRQDNGLTHTRIYEGDVIQWVDSFLTNTLHKTKTISEHKVMNKITNDFQKMVPIEKLTPLNKSDWVEIDEDKINRLLQSKNKIN